MDESKAALLAELYERVGSPGYATIARLSGGNVSKSSVENLLKGPGNPRFDTVGGFVQGCLAFAKSRRSVCGLAPAEREGAYWLARYRDAPGTRNEDPASDRREPEPGRSRLPSRTARFVGRADDVRKLLDLIGSHDPSARVVAIHAIDGMAGVGKTELALYIGGKVAGRFPDGAVFLDLAGYSPGLEPMRPIQALRLLLGQLGIDTDETDHDEATLRALWQDHCVRRRLLIILDNVRDREHVEPLLPHAAGCVVLITSRRKLVGLPGIVPFPLDVLSPDEATELLLSLAGAAATEADSAAVHRVVELCGRLPLAIGIAASMLAHRPGYTAVALAHDLDAERRHLGDLADEDGSLHIAVHASIRLSYQHLPANLKKVFRLCGWHPGPEVTAPALAAMLSEHRDTQCAVRVTDRDVVLSRRALHQLADWNLIRMQTAEGRYRMHDLVRASARLSRTGASEDERRHAVNHLTFACLATLERAESWRYGGASVQRLRLDDTPLSVFTGWDDASRWVTLERENLLALVDATDERSALISQLLGPALRDQGHLADAQHCFEDAERGYGRIGFHAGQTHAMRGLASIAARKGDHPAARRHYQRARSLSRRRRDDLGVALALRGLGSVARLTDDYDAGSDYLRRAIEILAARVAARDADPVAIREYAVALEELALVEKAQGRLSRAVSLLSRARDAYLMAGDMRALYHLLPTFAEMERNQGNFDAARKHLDELMRYSRTADDPDSEAGALWQLGQLEKESGDPAIAITQFKRVIDISRRTESQLGYARGLLGLADAERLNGQLDAARDHFEETLRRCLDLHDRDGAAQAYVGLGDVADAAGDPVLAKQHWRNALAISEEIGVEFVTGKARSRLAGFGT